MQILGKLPLQQHNITKIINNQKTTTLRTYKMPDGYYRINDNYIAYIKLRGFLSASECPTIIESESFENGPVFQSTKDFLDGKRKLYVYDISNLTCTTPK